MNKSLKAKNLPLFSIIDLDQLRRENHLEGTEVTDFFTARDGKVYLLMEQPSETQGKDWLSIPSTYTAVEIQLDWAEQRVLGTTLFPLGLLKFQFHYLRPAGEHFLLLGARCAYRENGPDQNAWIVSRDGAVLSRFCLGDGIQDCVVKKDGTIITSYFDEGVFGNYGWDEPLGDCGLIAWTSDGTPLWKNEKYSIYDCYAISLDEEENLWFYYYDEFRLVRTNFKEDFVFELPIEGSGAFSVAPSGNTFLFQGGYQQRDKFYFLTAHGDRLGQKQEAIISLPHPTSAKHPRMPLSDRAAQFAPFAALSDHSAALAETARLTDQRMELDKDARAALDLKQQLLLERIKERPEITVTWFQPDAKKDGGRYIVSTGRLKRIHEADQVLILADGLRIPIGDIVELESECIRGLL